MNKKNTNTVAIVLIALGLLILLNRLNVISFSVFFNGWWTLLLIVPAILSISKKGFQTGNSVLLALGTVFFLDEQGISLSGYLVPILLVVIGVALFLKKV